KGRAEAEAGLEAAAPLAPRDRDDAPSGIRRRVAFGGRAVGCLRDDHPAAACEPAAAAHAGFLPCDLDSLGGERPARSRREPAGAVSQLLRPAVAGAAARAVGGGPRDRL